MVAYICSFLVQSSIKPIQWSCALIISWQRHIIEQAPLVDIIEQAPLYIKFLVTEYNVMHIILQRTKFKMNSIMKIHQTRQWIIEA